MLKMIKAILEGLVLWGAIILALYLVLFQGRLKP
jgi:hypothetical protein